LPLRQITSKTEQLATSFQNKENEMSTIFSRIIAGEIPAEIVYRDGLVTAFRDINPQAPIHILIVPNKAIATVNDLTEEDELVAGRLLLVAKKLADQEGIAADGYRLMINCNQHGGQEVFHLHMHLLGGRPLGPMLARR
jgi:histidine triad (HIT) family protein